MEDTRTLGQLAAEALDVQNASNLSGVVHGFSRAVKRLREVCPGLDSVTLRRHPVVLWWVDKLSDLCGRVDSVSLSEAYDELYRLSGRVTTSHTGGPHDQG